MRKLFSATTLTRPANTTQYASGDLVANNTTAASVVPLNLGTGTKKGAKGIIRRVKLKKSDEGITAAAFRVHFFKSAPTVTNGDNGVFAPTESGYIGSVDVTVDKAFTDYAVGIASPTIGSEPRFDLGTTSIRLYVLLEARGTYTPASNETFDVECDVEILD